MKNIFVGAYLYYVLITTANSISVWPGALSALCPAAKAVLRNGCTRAFCGRCLQPASHRLLPPRDAAPITATGAHKNKRFSFQAGYLFKHHPFFFSLSGAGPPERLICLNRFGRPHPKQVATKTMQQG